MALPIYRFLKYIVYLIENFLISKQVKKRIICDKIALIHLDAIGDYILFRNFIQVLREHPKFKSNKLVFIGNSAYKDIFLSFDISYINEIIWVDLNKLLDFRHFIYRINFFNKLSKLEFNSALHPAFSRNFYLGDRVVKHIQSNEKIGYDGNYANCTPWQKKISDKFYTKLIKSLIEVEFEFYRNRSFFETILDTKLTISKLILPIEKLNINMDLPKKFGLIFVGGSSQKKKWHIENYLSLARFIQKKYQLEIIFGGGVGELNYNDRISRSGLNIINLIGKTSLLEMIFITSKAKIIVSNETAIPHFAVANGNKNIFVLYSGIHFGRFVPYPKEICENFFVINHPEIEKNIPKYKLESNQNENSLRKLNINDISYFEVENMILNNYEQ